MTTHMRWLVVILLSLLHLAIPRAGAVCLPNSDGNLTISFGQDCGILPNNASIRILLVRGLAAISTLTTFEVSNVTVDSTGVLTIGQEGTLLCGSLMLNSAGQLLIQRTGTVNASVAFFARGSSISGRLLAAQQGAGNVYTQTGGFSQVAGASHAGCGGQGGCIPSLVAGWSSSPANAAYGDFTAPTAPGSSAYGARGGAALRLHVNGTLTLNGAIDLSGGLGIGGCGGASGGALHITCGTLAPSNGSISVDGGGAVSNPYGGSAGRAAIVCARHSFQSNALADVSLQLTAAGGQSATSVASGAPGTIWLSLGTHLPTGAAFQPILLVRGAAAGVAAQPALLLWNGNLQLLDLTGAQIVIERGAVLQLIADASVPTGRTANASIVVPSGDSSGSYLEAGSRVSLRIVGNASVPLSNTLELHAIGLRFLAYSSLAGSHALSIAVRQGGGFGVTANAIETGDITVDRGGALHLAHNASLSCSSLQLPAGATMTVTMRASVNVSGDAIIYAGSSIDGAGRGYAPAQGPGANVSNAGAGGAHAGCSGIGRPGCLWPIIGDFVSPAEPGSGGMMSSGAVGGAGGAALRIHVGGSLALNGSVDVSGARFAAGGGGAGGSIFVTCGTLAPSNGSLVANGGVGGIGANFGGAAGRIAVVCRQHSFRSASSSDVTLQLAASGGANPSAGTGGAYPERLVPGAPGSIYLEAASSAVGPGAPTTGQFGRMRLLLIRGPSSRAAAPPAVIGRQGLAQVDELRLENGAALALMAPYASASSSWLPPGWFSLSVAMLSTDGNNASALFVAPNASAFITRQSLALTGASSSSSGTTATGLLIMMPSNLTVLMGAERVAAVLNAATVLSAAQVELTDAGCLTVDTCTSFVGDLRIAGSGLYHACSDGTIAQRWAAAALLSVAVCTDSAITARFNFSSDPGPWLYYSANVSLIIPQALGADAVESNAVAVVLPASAPPTVRSPGLVRWSEIFQLNGTLLGRVVSSTSTRLLVENGATALPLVPTGATTAHSTIACLRYVDSSWVPAVPGTRSWSVRILLEVTRPAGSPDAGNMRRVQLVATITIPAVEPVAVRLPQLLPRAGGVPSSGALILPARPWSDQEVAAVGRQNACRVTVGPFSVQLSSCPYGSATGNLASAAGNYTIAQADLLMPRGYGADWPVTLELGGGLLTISLGRASFAPGGIALVWPPAMNLPSPGDTPTVNFTIDSAVCCG